MSEMITLAEAARRLGLTDRRVAQLANGLGFVERLGQSRYLTAEQFAAVQAAHAECRPYVKTKGL
jgi:hypothetical protein